MSGIERMNQKPAVFFSEDYNRNYTNEWSELHGS